MTVHVIETVIVMTMECQECGSVWECKNTDSISLRSAEDEAEDEETCDICNPQTPAESGGA